MKTLASLGLKQSSSASSRLCFQLSADAGWKLYEAVTDYLKPMLLHQSRKIGALQLISYDFFDVLRILPGFPISWRILGSSPSTTTFESERLSGLLGAPQIFNSARRGCGCPAPARREKNDATAAIPTTLSSYS